MTKQSIEDRALPTWTTRVALEEMNAYRTWSPNTYKAYLRDADRFEDFSLEEGFEPTLENIKLHHVQKYINRAQDDEAYNSTKRVIASLSSVFSFYKELGTIKGNPFKATALPVGDSGHHSRALEFEEIVDVFEAIQQIKDVEGLDLSIAVETLFFTGLRNHGFPDIKVKDVYLDKELIYYYAGYVNGKHKVQYFPVPARLLEKIKQYIQDHQLQPEDQLIHGLKGLDLKNKQLNRVINRINKELGWVGDKHVTPHGYRSSIATILDEREVEHDNIKYLLGHSITKDSLDHYLRRDNRKIRALRNELTKIENEIYQELDKRLATNTEDTKKEALHTYVEGQVNENHHQTTDQPVITIQYFLELTKTNPQLAQKLAAMNLVEM